MVGLCNVTKNSHPVIGHFIYSLGFLRYIGSRWYKLLSYNVHLIIYLIEVYHISVINRVNISSLYRVLCLSGDDILDNDNKLLFQPKNPSVFFPLRVILTGNN